MSNLADIIKSYNKQLCNIQRGIITRISKVGWNDNLLSTEMRRVHEVEMQRVNELEMQIEVLLQQLHATRDSLPPAYSYINCGVQPPCYDSLEPV